MDSTKAIHTLIDSNGSYAFGSSCGRAGISPKGKIAINTIYDVGNFNLIDSLFRVSKDTEGKMYLAEAILRLNLLNSNLLSNKSRILISKFLNSNESISICSGCVYFGSTINELVNRRKDLKNLIRKNMIELDD